MRFMIQRVLSAKCEVEGKTTGEIGRGFCVFIGVAENDTCAIADRMVAKLLAMRIFADENGKTNLALRDVGGGLLLIPQFTLYADFRKGNRPSFSGAGNPELAERLYEYIVEKCAKDVAAVGRGVFGAEMKISLCNDGPFTLILDSDAFSLISPGEGSCRNAT